MRIYSSSKEGIEFTEDGGAKTAKGTKHMRQNDQGHWKKMWQYRISSRSAFLVIEQENARLFIGSLFPKGFHENIKKTLLLLHKKLTEVKCENRKDLYYFDKLQQLFS